MSERNWKYNEKIVINTKKTLTLLHFYSVAVNAFVDLNKLKVLYHGPGVAFDFFLI